ncbi:hypothetical protein ACHAQH_007793 [Verticillium albo-atrum]
MTEDPPLSQASSHFPIEPVSASVLAARERRRRDGLRRRGAMVTGCREFDEVILLGGLERGSVVGMSAEEEDFGMQLAFQAVARSLADGGERAMILTTLTAGAVLPGLRDAIRARLAQVGREGEELKGAVRECLRRVSVATVFDVEGVWEVLGEVDSEKAREVVGDGAARGRGRNPSVHGDAHRTDHDEELKPIEEGHDTLGHNEATTVVETERESMPPPPAAQQSQTNGKIVLPELKPGRAEIADSEDEEAISSLSSSPLSSPPASSLDSVPPGLELSHEEAVADGAVDAASSGSLAGSSADSSTESLDAVLQVLAPMDGPVPSPMDGTPAQAADTPSRMPSSRPLDPTLRSVFNPPQLAMAGYRSLASRRNKPSFGMVFAQMLDLHLLCTRVPRGAEDAERVFGDAPGEASFVWVVEVLLDEMGVWEEGKGPRQSREQRWGAVSLVEGRLVDAFEPTGPAVLKEIRLAAGFGGPRV